MEQRRGRTSVTVSALRTSMRSRRALALMRVSSR
jgi:hypothetical protein